MLHRHSYAELNFPKLRTLVCNDSSTKGFTVTKSERIFKTFAYFKGLSFKKNNND